MKLSTSSSVAAVTSEAVVRSFGGLLARKPPSRYAPITRSLAALRLEVLPAVSEVFHRSRGGQGRVLVSELDAEALEAFVRSRLAGRDLAGAGTLPADVARAELIDLSGRKLSDSDASLICRSFAVSGSRAAAGRAGAAGTGSLRASMTMSAHRLVDWGRLATWMVGTIDAAAGELERVETEAESLKRDTHGPGAAADGNASGVAAETTPALALAAAAGAAATGGHSASLTPAQAEALLDAWLEEGADGATLAAAGATSPEAEGSEGGAEGFSRWPETTVGGWLKHHASRLERVNAARSLLLLEAAEEQAGTRPRGMGGAIKRALHSAAVRPLERGGVGAFVGGGGGGGSGPQAPLHEASGRAALMASSASLASLLAGGGAVALPPPPAAAYPPPSASAWRLGGSVPPSVLSRSLVAALGAGAAVPPGATGALGSAVGGGGGAGGADRSSTVRSSGAGDFLEDGPADGATRSSATLLPVPVRQSHYQEADRGGEPSGEVAIALGPSLRMVVRFETV